MRLANILVMLIIATHSYEASAQTQPIEPPESCFPTDTAVCCFATYTTAVVVIDGPVVIIDDGVPMISYTGWGECDNCRQPDCFFCDSTFDSINCVRSFSVTVSNNYQESLHIGLEAGLSATVKAQLEGALGVSSGISTTDSIDCPIPTNPCEYLKLRVKITRHIGVKAEIRHKWNLTGIWVALPASYGCGFGSCPIAGYQWNKTCPTTSSIATATTFDLKCTAAQTAGPCIMMCEQ